MSDFGGWGAIIKEAQSLVENPPPELSCPKCGTPLDTNSRGEKNCPMGHYRTR
jgi:Zn finger protein HypA/HybF involved in hydrogenase expression